MAPSSSKAAKEKSSFIEKSPINDLLPNNHDWENEPYRILIQNPKYVARFIERKFETEDDLKTALRDHQTIPEHLSSKFSIQGRYKGTIQKAWEILRQAYDCEASLSLETSEKNNSITTISEADESEIEEADVKVEEEREANEDSTSITFAEHAASGRHFSEYSAVAKRLPKSKEWKQDAYFIQIENPIIFAHFLETAFTSEDALLGTLHENHTIPESLFRRFTIQNKNREEADAAWDFLQKTYNGGRPFQSEDSKIMPYKPRHSSSKGVTVEDLRLAIEGVDADIVRFHQKLPDFVKEKYIDPNDQLEGIWAKHRETLGFKGDCRYPWEKIADMSLIELIEADADLEQDLSLPDPSNILEVIQETNKQSISDSALEKHTDLLSTSRSRLNAIRLNGIKAEAEALSHDEPGPIRAWGKEIDLARVQASRQLSDRTVKSAAHTQSKISSIHDELSKLLSAKQPSWFGGLAIKAAKSFGLIEGVKTRRGKNKNSSELSQQWDDSSKVYNYYAMDEEQKKDREQVLIRALEDAIREEIEAEEDYICEAEKSGEIMAKYQMLVQQHRTELGRHRTRLISAAKNSTTFQTDAEENAIVVRDKSAKLERDIDDRMDALAETLEVCERERDHYESLEELHKEHKETWIDAIAHSIEALRNFRRIEQQVILTQNIELAGEYSRNLGNISFEKKLKLVSARLREARAEEVKKLGSMKQLMESNEALVLAHQKPIALIEDQSSILDTEAVPA